MRSLLIKYNYLLFLVILFFIAELLVRPFGNFPLNDDWSYAKSVLILVNDARLDIGYWPAMTLATHIVWGALFVKVFGFSFLVLRISTLVSAIICLFALYSLILKISRDKIIAFISSLTLLFNPIFFNMSNTFMTDVNFLTLFLLCAYLAYDFFVEDKLSSFFLVFVLSTLLVLLRQYGIVVPAAMVISCLFLKKKKLFYFGVALVFTLLIFAIFMWYERYLRTILPVGSSYKFSGNFNPGTRVFWDSLYYGITTRYKIVGIHALFYTFPLVAVWLMDSVRTQAKMAVIFISVPVFCLVYYLFKDYPLQVGNVFEDAGVGADTFYETQKGTFIEHKHNYSASFFSIVTPLKYVLISLSLILIIFFLKKIRNIKRGPVTKHPEIIFLTTLFIAYLVMILITESFFDRYQLPVIALSLILFAYFQKVFKPAYWLSLVPLLGLFYISVFGTRDYFTVNNKKWEAYHYLCEEKKVDGGKINGGFEIIWWDDGKDSRWHNSVELRGYEYLIQFKSEDDFELFKEYPFQKYFPFKKDTLRIFKRKPHPTEIHHAY
ncbi:MAG: glycosyltransferase family 39 protein [bacterium]|nr:glycosyltransferase family 39 protein [bacterium]